MGIREIIFRAKVKFERLISAKPNEKKEQVVKWVYWGVYGQTVDEIGNAFPYNVDGLRVVYIDTARRFIIPETVGRYTGVTVGNEKLFECDIVEWHEDYDDTWGYTQTAVGRSVVVWDEENFCWAFETDGCLQSFNDWNWNSSFIIGNIHDNPELLEGEK